MIESPPTLAVALHGIVGLLAAPSDSAELVTEILFGETVMVHQRVGTWCAASMQFGSFRCNGFVNSQDIGEPTCMPTHRVNAQWTVLRDQPNKKARILERLSCGSIARVLDEDEYHYRVWPHGWLLKCHLAEMATRNSCFVQTITSFAGTPFVWGGRSTFGMDCSGLIQLGLMLCGVEAPRDEDDMADVLGVQVDDNDLIRPGDFLFYQDHCAMFVDSTTVINGNGIVARVVIEPFVNLHDRMVRLQGRPYTCRRRIVVDKAR